MKRIEKSIIMVMLLSLIFIYATGEALAAKVTVENKGAGHSCDYEIVFSYKDQNGGIVPTPAVYLTYGSSHTFDSGNNAPYLLDHSMCKVNHANYNLGAYLVKRWIDTVQGDSNWKIEMEGVNNYYKPK